MTNKVVKLLTGVAALSLIACGGKTEKNSVSLVSMMDAQMAPAVNPYAKGMVAAANPHAVDAGLEALRAGGTAVDAAIAVQAVLGLVEPQSSGIAGGAFMIFYEANTGKVTAYNGREKAPMGIDENLFLDENGERLRYLDGIVSGRSTGVPGVIAMLHMAHDDHGKRAWGDNFSSGIKLAEDGFAVSARLAMLIKMAEKYALTVQPEARAYFFREDGTPLEEGFVRDNKPYAESLRAIAADYRAMYEGPLAEKIVAAVQQEPRPGFLTLADMKAYTPGKSEALCSPYRDTVLCGAIPPSSGGIAVQSIMGQLANYDMKAFFDTKTGAPTLEGWHVFAEASEMAYADRDLFVADPDFVNVPTRAMLDPAYLKSRADLISMDSSLKDVNAGDPVNFKPGIDATPDKKGTSHFSIVDKWGNVVSMTTTVESVFGSERMAGGFMLNNQLTDFSFVPRDAQGNLINNRPQSGKRPRSSMAPHIVFDKDGQFSFATGSPGGSSIIAYTAKSMIAMIDWGMSPKEAVELANFISRNGSIRLEEVGLAPDIITGLEAKGHKVIRSKGEISGLHIIRRNKDGSYEGAADPRREGAALSE